MKHIKRNLLAIICMICFVYLTYCFSLVEGLSLLDVVAAFLISWLILPFAIIMIGFGIKDLIKQIKEDNETLSW